MLRIEKLQEKNFVGSWDLDEGDRIYKELTATIVDVYQEERFAPGANEKQIVTVMSFKECKPLILNATNINAVKKMYGFYVDKWKGEKVTLYVQKDIKAFGGITDAIRIRDRKPAKENFNPQHQLWNAAKNKIANGKATIEDIKKVYSISENDAKLLTDGTV